MAEKTATIDGYLAAVPDHQRAALERLRRTVRDVVPAAQECIGYGLPAFRHDGKLLVGFGASAKHCALYLFSGATVAAHADVLAGYDTSKGTVRFAADQPLPEDLVRTLVRARIVENGG